MEAAGNAAAQPQALTEAEKDLRLTELILQHHQAKAHIHDLEATVQSLRAQLEGCAGEGSEDNEKLPASHPLRRPSSSPSPAISSSSSAAAAAAAARMGKTAFADHHHHHAAAWNEELIATVEAQRGAMLRLETDAKAQLIVLADQLGVVQTENEQLRRENAALKERVADDVLRQRQTNRIEMAFEKAKIASRVRLAGLRRMQAMEAVLMEAHDDLYHIQRWDAGYAPQRDVSFVFTYVANLTFPLAGTEEFVITVYQQILSSIARRYAGYAVATSLGMEVYAFQQPVAALQFARECQEQVVRLGWPERVEGVPCFASIVEQNTLVFRGPRMHTCIYACQPECEINAVTGRHVYYGTQVRAAVEAALEQASVGEIVVNDVWTQLFLRDVRRDETMATEPNGTPSTPFLSTATAASTNAAVSSAAATAAAKSAGGVVPSPPTMMITPSDSGLLVPPQPKPIVDVNAVRAALGKQWDVIAMPGHRHIVCSLLPVALKARRGVPFHALFPTPKYPCAGLDASAAVRQVLKAMKSAARVEETLLKFNNIVRAKPGGEQAGPNGPAAGSASATGVGAAPLATLTGRRRSLTAGGGAMTGVGGVGATAAASNNSNGGDMDVATRLLEYYCMQEERDKTAELLRHTERICAVLESQAMSREDRFELAKRKPLDPSEIAYVCTIDTGDDTIWRGMLLSSLSAEEYELARNTMRSFIHNAGKQYYGFLMNGNYVDIFTYVFREVEQALAFVSQVYIMVNRTGTKYAGMQGISKEVFLFRAGITGGPMSTIYRNVENGLLKCTGPVIRLSGTLCDLARSGEILAMEDVIATFQSKNENLLDQQYNIVKHRGQFLNGCDAPAVVHSILPRPFAYRRTTLMSMDGGGGGTGDPRGSTSGGGGGAAAHTPAILQPAKSNNAKAALLTQASQFPREQVERLLQQLLERLERTEAAQLAGEDRFEATQVAWRIRNPWMFVRQPVVRRSMDQGSQAMMLRNSVFTPTENKEGPGLMSRRGTLTTSLTSAAAAAAAMQETSEKMSFLYCDMVGTAALARSLPAALLADVTNHYNYVVQGIFAEYDGYVVKTNSLAAYIVAFVKPEHALEAALLIQKRLVAQPWPAALRPLEHTLYVRDSKTDTVLFSGPRAQVAVHVSGQYTWRRLASSAAAPTPTKSISSLHNTPTTSITPLSSTSGGSGSRRGSILTRSDGTVPATPTAACASTTSVVAAGPTTNTAGAAAATYVDVTGIGIEELLLLGRRAHGGEIRLSQPFMTEVGHEVHGKLLLKQLAMEVIVAPSAITVVPSAAAALASGAGELKLMRSSSSVWRAPPPPPSPGARKRRSVVGHGEAGEPRGSVAGGGRRALYTVPVSKECVTAVPRELQGRFAFLLPAAAAAGASATTGPVVSTMLPPRQVQQMLHSPNKASGGGGMSGPKPTTLPVNSSLSSTLNSRLTTLSQQQQQQQQKVHGEEENDEVRQEETESGEGTGSGNTTLNNTTNSSSKAGEGNERPIAAALPAPPLPPLPAAQTAWSSEPQGALAPLPTASCAGWEVKPEAEGTNREARKVQRLLGELLRECPTAASVTAEAEKSNTSSSTTTITSSAADGSASRRLSTAIAPPTTLPSLAMKKGGAAALQASATAAGAPGSATTATGAAAPQNHYALFMDTLHHLFDHLQTAVQVGNDHIKPPPLPKSAAALPATPAPPSSSGLQRPSSSSSSVSGGAMYSGRKTSTASPPRPPSLSPTREPSLGPAGCNTNSSSASTDAYRTALQYLEGACRAMAQEMSSMLGTVPAIPAAPRAKGKAFTGSLPSVNNRRFGRQQYS